MNDAASVDILTVCDILEKLEGTSKRTEKETILFEHKENELLREVFRAALDPYTNYGVVKFKKNPAMLTPTDVLFEKHSFGTSQDMEDRILADFLLDLLPQLATRALSGNAAKSAVENAFAYMNGMLRKWCERILIHKLRNGVQAKTVNKIWPKTICPFEVQLASVLEAVATEDGEGFVINDHVSYPTQVEPKLDGLRLIAIKHLGIVTLYTRNGTELETLPSLIKALEECELDNFVLDGEAMGDDWNESASIIMSRSRMKDDVNITYHVFDIMSYDEWRQRKCNDPLEKRRERLIQVAALFLSKTPVRPTDIRICSSDDDIKEFYLKCLDEGYEGVMVKDISSVYAFKRNLSWRKLKPEATYEGVVVGTYDGNKGSKREGKFGGYSVLLPNGIVTKVGSGFSDAHKAEIDTDRNSWVGKIVELAGQPPLTKDGKIRFPRLKRYRDESDVDPKVIEAYEAYIPEDDE